MYHGVTQDADRESVPPSSKGESNGKDAKKERVLHTRVPAVLERELKRFADNLRVPVSNLVRTILEDALSVADAVGATSIAFPAISTGVFGYPPGLAAEVAVTSVRGAETDVTLVRFVAFDGATLEHYLALL